MQQKNGLQFLDKQIKFLLEQEKDHCHLMTSSFVGNQLTEKIQGNDNKLINHVNIFLWND